MKCRAALRLGALAANSPVPLPPGFTKPGGDGGSAEPSAEAASHRDPAVGTAAPPGPSPLPAPRLRRNRILMLATALGKNDTPQWPFWKWQHIKATRTVTDFAMLAVTREGCFVGVIRDGVASMRQIPQQLKTVEPELLERFLTEHYTENSYFVYGGHGDSDILGFDKNHRMQLHELGDALGARRFLGILLDACLLASIDTAYHLRRNAPFIGASEGYMWEEDTWAENHMFNAYSAALMARDSDGERVLKLIGEEYTGRSGMADYTVIDTEHAEALWQRVHDVHLAEIHASVRLKPEVKNGEVPVEVDFEIHPDFDVAKLPRHKRAAQFHSGIGKDGKRRYVPPPDFPPEATNLGFIVPRSWAYRNNYYVPNALYPQQEDDDHIVDLRACIEDDPETLALFHKVVAWHRGPANRAVYAVEEMGGLNLSLSQYAYWALRKPVPKEEAETLAQRFSLAASSIGASIQPSLLATPVRAEPGGTGDFPASSAADGGGGAAGDGDSGEHHGEELET